MKNLNFKKTAFLIFVLYFNSFSANSTSSVSDLSFEKEQINNEHNIDGILKRKKFKANKSPNYAKKRNRPSPISQYNLRNQSKSALKSLRKNQKRHVCSKRKLHYRHRRHIMNF